MPRRIQRWQESEERFRALNECSPVGVFLTDVKGDCTYSNALCSEICGFSTEEALGGGWARFLHPDDGERVVRELSRALRAGEGYEGDNRWLHCNGEVRWTVMRSSVVRTESGKLLGSMVTVADRTLRMAAEQKATTLARELDAVGRSSPVAIICLELDSTVRSWNPMAENILGWRAEEIIGKKLPIPRSQERQWEDRCEKLIRGESLINEASRSLHKDGHEVDVLISDAPLFDHSGSLTGFICSIVDATELVNSRRQLENTVAELSESAARFQAMADSMDQFAWMADATGWIFWYNKRWFDYTGTTLEEMQGWGWRKVHHPDHVDRVVERIQKCWDCGEPWEDTFPLRGKDGTYRWFLSRALPIKTASGEVIRWFGTNTDITERMMAEEAVRQSEKLMIAGKLAASVSHELNNPLAGAINSVYLACQMATDPIQRRYLTDADRELQRVSRLANRTLSFYRGNASKESITVFAIVQELVSVFEPYCAQKNIRVLVDPRCSAIVHGSRDELRQAFSNLLSNAIDAVGCDGRVHIRVKAVRSPGSDIGRVWITIADTGHGISDVDRKSIFKPFFTTKTTGGTGLGLWITEDIVSRHDGSIRFKSRCDARHGTVISICLPALQISQQQEPGAD
jgi:PAS domain S-box-containing protein